MIRYRSEKVERRKHFATLTTFGLCLAEGLTKIVTKQRNKMRVSRVDEKNAKRAKLKKWSD